MATLSDGYITRFHFILMLFGAFLTTPAFAETFFTSFEFSDSGTFSIGTPPFTASFSGGTAQTVGVGAYYHSGRFSWHVPNSGMADITFETPVESVDFWFRDTNGASSSSYRIFDTNDTVIGSGNGSQSFINVELTRSGSQTRIARLEFESAGGGDTVVDDFGYEVTEPMLPADENIIIRLEEPLDGQVYSGVANIRGWAISIDSITRVELYIDDKLKGNIPYGGSRDDVGKKNPQIPNSGNSGFSMAFSYSGLPLGQHTVRIRAISKTDGFREASGTFTVAKFHQPFFPDPNVVNLSNSQVGTDGTAITIRNLSVDGQLYDVRLQWRTQTQGFEFTEIR